MNRGTYNRAAETAAQRRAQRRAWDALQQRLAARADVAERRWEDSQRHVSRAGRRLHELCQDVGRPCPHCAGEVTR